MLNTKFEVYKLRRELKKIGTEYEFERLKLNSFKEPTDESEPVGKLVGLYHEQNSNISVTTGETTQTRTKKVPMILCLYEDAKAFKFGDIVKINSKICKLVGIVNIHELSIIADISLEVIDDGIHD